jgi:hypothetical protein
MGMLLSEGEIKCDVLVLHTMASAWVNWYGDNREKRIRCNGIQKNLFDVMETLDRNQVLFHLGDDKIMKKYGKVCGNKISVGEMTYSTVIVPSSSCMDSNTLSLITEFANGGGNVVFVGEVPYLVDGENSDKVKTICKNKAENSEEIFYLELGTSAAEGSEASARTVTPTIYMTVPIPRISPRVPAFFIYFVNP